MDDWRVVLRRYKLLTLIRFVFIVTSSILGMTGFNLWMTLFVPLYWLRSEVYFLICNHFRDVSNGMIGIQCWFLGWTIVEVGSVVEDILPDKSIVIMNHQSVHDGTFLYGSLGKRGLAHAMGYLGDHWIKYTHYGYGGILSGDVFIDQRVSEDEREAQMARVTKEVTSLFEVPSGRKWFMFCPEGGLLHKRRTKSQQYAKKNGFPVLQHVALPRVGAMEAIVKAFIETSFDNSDEATSEEWKWFIDATIAYPDGKSLPMSDMMTGALSPCQVTICYRIFPASDVPTDTDGMQKWLFERFVEKEAMLEYFYKHGHFPEDYFTRNHDRPVRNRPQPISWNCYSAGLGYVILLGLHVWSGIMVWSFLLNFMQHSYSDNLRAIDI